MSTKLLNRRQTRWAEFLSRFNFKIVYRPGKAGGKPDSLTRRLEDLPKGGDERLRHMEQAILKPKNLPKELLSIHTVALLLAGIQRRPPNSTPRTLPIIAIGHQDLEFEAHSIQDLEALADVGLVTEVEVPLKSQEVQNMRLLADNLPPPGALPTLEEQMTQAYQNDPLALEIFEALRIGAQRNRTLSLVDCRSVNNKLFYQDRLYVPDNEELRLRVIQWSHDTPVAGHPGRERTFELLTRKYFWPSM